MKIKITCIKAFEKYFHISQCADIYIKMYVFLLIDNIKHCYKFL